MGKSDALIFPVYSEMLSDIAPASVAFLGFSGENSFTRTISSTGFRHFYDLSLGNWEINSDWKLASTYDLIVSTRCPYFSSDPKTFIKKCLLHTNAGGSVLIDWGLGDHWRFEKYKVGWVRENEHEYAYGDDNKLYSCLWRDEFLENEDVKTFQALIRGRFGYSVDANLADIIKAEVPSVIDYEFDRVRFKCLWPESPQLYIVTIIKN